MRTTLLIALVSAGCSYHARSPEQYQADTLKELSAHQGEVKGCYDDVLRGDGKAKGVVRVRFDVQEETGKFTNTQVVEEDTSASPEISECVVKSIEGLSLTPPDARTGKATFTYEFSANAPKQIEAN